MENSEMIMALFGLSAAALIAFAGWQYLRAKRAQKKGSSTTSWTQDTGSSRG